MLVRYETGIGLSLVASYLYFETFVGRATILSEPLPIRGSGSDRLRSFSIVLNPPHELRRILLLAFRKNALPWTMLRTL